MGLFDLRKGMGRLIEGFERGLAGVVEPGLD